MEIFPSHRQRRGRAAAELSQGWRLLLGGSSAATSTTPKSLRCPSPSPPRGHLDNVGRVPSASRDLGSVTTPASRSPKQSQGESEGKARRSLHYLSSALPRRAPGRVAPPGSARSAPLLNSRFPGPPALRLGACPPAPPPPPVLAHAHAAPGGPRRCHGGAEQLQ